jgi:hypothetical protein
MPRPYCSHSCFTFLQVRSELYTAANVAALNRIRTQLQLVRNAMCTRSRGYRNDHNQALDQAKATLQRSEVQLRKYMDMGTGKVAFIHYSHFLTLYTWFDALVEEYTRLIEHLEDKQWTMQVAAYLSFLFYSVVFDVIQQECFLAAYRHCELFCIFDRRV